MVVVMAPEANEADIKAVVSLVETAGGDAFVSRGVERTIVGLVGDVQQFGSLNLRGMRGVTDVIRISAPYKLVSRENHGERSVVRVGGVPIGPGTMTLIAGPCAVETPEQTLGAAQMAQAAGESGKPVMLKRGMNGTIEEWLMAAEYVAQRGNLDIVLCERGIRTFETATRNTLDISAVPVAQRLSHLPVIVDPSHSGGSRDLVLPLTRAAIAVGADGVIIDVHPHPETALCDGPQALVDGDLRELAKLVRDMPPIVGRSLTQAEDPDAVPA
jgi:3-deoxy-D-arabino-heptulosonate 7-phosphate (DAHP) synthase